METDQFYSKSYRLDSPLKKYGIVKFFTGVALILFTWYFSGSINSLISGISEENGALIAGSALKVLAIVVLCIVSLSFLFGGIKYIKKITITPEIPSPFRNYTVVFDNLLKGKLDIYKFPDYGPLKFAYDYVNDKIPFLTPPKREVVAKNVVFFRKFIFLFVALLVIYFVLKYIPVSLFEDMDIEPLRMRFPVFFLFVFFAIMAISFYTIFMIIPENVPLQVVSENFATINGGGDPNSICPAIDKTLNDYRFDKLPNYTHKSGFSKIEDLSFNESASYSGCYSVETHPRYINAEKTEIIPVIYLTLAVLCACIAVFYFNTISISELDTSSVQSGFGKLLAGFIFMGTSSNMFHRALLIYNTYQFESVFTYLDINGTIGKSEITAGKAITDSIETRNVVIRSDSQFKVYTSRLLSESYTLNGERYITAMNVDDHLDEVTQKILLTINNFKSEGVTIRGIDVTSESISQITSANLMIQQAKRTAKPLQENEPLKLNTQTIKSVEAAPTELVTGDTKECPRCAETIKAKAKMCRYCNYEFE